MKKAPLPLLILFTLVIIINSCKKPNEIEENRPQMANNKWAIIPKDIGFTSTKGSFYEDVDGNITYRRGDNFYSFDDNGTLLQTQLINVPNNESNKFIFLRDGTFLIKMNPFNTPSSDFILFYQRQKWPFSYLLSTMFDLRKLDSTNTVSGEYYIHYITPNNLTGSLSSSYWVLASKYTDIRALEFNRNPKRVLILLSNNNVAAEFELPPNIWNHYLSTSSSHFCLYQPDLKKIYSFDKFGFLTGTQEDKLFVPNIHVLRSFVLRAGDGYYLSEDAIELKNKIPNLQLDATILHSKDSLLHIFTNGNYLTMNAITGEEVFKLDTKSDKMPINIDSVGVVDYYRSHKGIAYLVTSKGFVVIN